MTDYFLAGVFEAEFNAYTSALEPDLRVFLLAPDPTSGRGLSPLDFGGDVPGEIVDGYLYETRDFDSFGGEVPAKLKIAIREPYTGALLRQVAGVGIIEQGASTGALYRAEPLGIRNVPSEAVAAWTLERVTDDFAVPLAPLVTEGGSPLLTELGAVLTMEAA